MRDHGRLRREPPDTVGNGGGTAECDSGTGDLDRRIVTIEIGETALRVYHERGDTLINQVPRTITAHLSRHKAYGVARTAQQASGPLPLNRSRSVPHLEPDTGNGRARLRVDGESELMLDVGVSGDA